MRAGLRYTQRLDPVFRAGNAVVPALAHELQAVGWIAHDRVDAVGLHAVHHVATIPLIAVIQFHNSDLCPTICFACCSRAPAPAPVSGVAELVPGFSGAAAVVETVARAED